MVGKQIFTPVISASIIIFTEAIPLNFVRGVNVNQLLYILAFIISFSPIELISYLKSIYFKRIYLVFLIFQLLKFYIGTYVKTEAEFEIPYYYSISSFILIYIFFRIRNFNQIYSLTKILLLFLMINAGFGLLNFLFGGPFAIVRAFLVANKEGWLFFGKGDRIAGFSPTLFHYGYQVVLLPVLMFMLYMWKRKNSYLTIAIISGFIVILTGERASLGAVVLVLFLIIRYLKIKVRLLPLLFSIVTIIVSINYFQKDLFSEDSSISRLTSEESDLEDRFIKMGSALQTVFNNPFNGGTVYEYEYHFSRISGYYPSSPHNTYINVGRYVGIIGFFLLFLFFKKIYQIINQTVRYLNNSFKKLYIGYLYSFIAVLIVGFFHNGGVFTKEPWTWIILGFLISFHRCSLLPRNKIELNNLEN